MRNKERKKRKIKPKQVKHAPLSNISQTQITKLRTYKPFAINYLNHPNYERLLYYDQNICYFI